MSPAVKSKSKSSTKSVKEQQKSSQKLLSAPVNGGSSLPGGAYNPILGTFHSLERASSPPSVPQSNGRFRNMDEREEHSGSSSGTPEDDSVSSGSCSGESEDQKEKMVASTKPRQDGIPGSDTEKRDKIRQKNERKHQRQRERRAQELHERCTGYLMSSKLETLTRQLVAMGFSSERATTALIMNEGRLEESVAWLFEGGEGEQPNLTNIDVASNLKIDICDEVAKMGDLEAELKCPKQEVERVIVACEGDLEKAAEILRAQKQEPTAAPSKPEGCGEPATAEGEHKGATSTQNTTARTLIRVANPVTPAETEFNYSKAAVAGSASLGSRNRNLQPPSLQSKAELSIPQVPTPVEKRWPLGASSNQSVPVSYSALPSTLRAAPAEVDTRFSMVGSEMKTNLQLGGLREPVVVMQRPQTLAQHRLPSTSVALGVPPAVTAGLYPTRVPSVDPVNLSVGGFGSHLQNLSSTTSGTGSAVQFHMNQHHQSLMSSSVDTASGGWGGSSWSAAGMCSGTSSSSLTVPSSLGLFTGWASSGSSGSSSPVDWSTGGSMMQCDYASIDWSLDSTPSWRSKTDRDWLCDTWATTVSSGRPGVNGGLCMAGLLDSGLVLNPLPPASHEWTSPFAGKDLFSLSRRFVTSPSL